MIKILGIKIDFLSKKMVLEKVESWFKADSNFYIITTPNPEIVVASQNNHQLKQHINNSDLAVCDGVGLLIFSALYGNRNFYRIPGSELIFDLCKFAEKNSLSVGLLGARGDTSSKAGEKLQSIFPKIKIVFSKAEISPSDNLKCDFLFVAYGAGKQEEFLFQQKERSERGANIKVNIKFKVGMGVGGVFDVLSGNLPEVPLLFKKTGLEWFWRLLIQPFRIKRIFNAVIYFPILVLTEVLRVKKY